MYTEGIPQKPKEAPADAKCITQGLSYFTKIAYRQ